MSLTARSPLSQGLEPYLREIAQIPPLSEEESARLYRSAAEGDLSSRERIALAHLHFVVRIAYQYSGYGLPLADLISEGNLGLLRATELFNPALQVPFTTYASVWVKQRIHRAITAQAHVVRIPVWKSQRLRKLDRLHEDLNAELGRDAEITELAERIGIPEETLSRIAAERFTFAAINPETDEALPFQDPAPLPSEALHRQELNEEITACLHGLDDTELQILSHRFGLHNNAPESYRAMAPRFGKSREWIRKIGERALAKVKESLQTISHLPRESILKRRQQTQQRLDLLAKKHLPIDSSHHPLSLWPVVLTEWVEILFIV